MAMDLGLADVEWADGEGGGLRKSGLDVVASLNLGAGLSHASDS